MAYDELKKIIDESDNIVFFGGAGVSTESGIPDFRSADGLYNAKTKYGVSPEEMISRTYFNQHTDKFYDYYFENMVCTKAKPNVAHFALASLEKQGKLKAIVTQNIDNLHQMAGSKNVLELHGSVYRNYCMDCHQFYSLSEILDMDGVPHCEKCGGVIKPDVVLYEEPLDNKVWDKAYKAVSDCDVLIVGGTSLVVYPAASLVSAYRGNKLVLINKGETPYDNLAKLAIHESLGKVFSAVV
jgi:NAD-dependent deacetylase